MICRKKANALLKTQDWTARVFILSHWKKELDRFYSSVFNLPAPKGLTEEEQKEYKSLLISQMQVYVDQIKQLEGELNTLWSQDFLNDYKIGLKQDSIFYPVLRWELDKLAESAEGKQKDQIHILISSLEQNSEKEKTNTKDRVELEKINILYGALKDNPFDETSLTELLSLEKQRKNTALSFYLADRIKELNQKRKGEPL